MQEIKINSEVSPLSYKLKIKRRREQIFVRSNFKNKKKQLNLGE